MADDKPEVLRDATFTVREGLGYRILRGGAIWMNKLFFSSLILLAIWLLWAFAAHTATCVNVVTPNGTLVDRAHPTQCSPFLTDTAKFLGVMSLLTFGASILFGLLGLVVGKDIVQAARAEDEVGARRDRDPDPAQDASRDMGGRGPLGPP